jgi:hypothetical protein
MEDFSSNDTHSNKSIRPIALVSQLMPLVANMYHIDELLVWLASMMVERLGIVSTQVWSIQAYSTEQMRSKLRASTSQHAFQASQVVESAEVRVFVERMLRDQRGLLSVPVTRMFSQYQANIFAQQDCLYWTTYFLSKEVLLPPPQKNPERDEIATPLQMIFSFFTSKPLQASDARTISFLIEQSFRIAISRGLLTKVSAKAKKVNQLALDYLIPERIEDNEIEQGENPFNSAVVIPEKISRQMYSLLDGKKNVGELTTLLHVNRKEMGEMLQVLLAKGYIRVREAGGNIVDVATFSQLN